MYHEAQNHRCIIQYHIHNQVPCNTFAKIKCKIISILDGRLVTMVEMIYVDIYSDIVHRLEIFYLYVSADVFFCLRQEGLWY